MVYPASHRARRQRYDKRGRSRAVSSDSLRARWRASLIARRDAQTTSNARNREPLRDYERRGDDRRQQPDRNHHGAEALHFEWRLVERLADKARAATTLLRAEWYILTTAWA